MKGLEKPTHRCRGQYETLSEEQKREVEKNCLDPAFSEAMFLIPREIVELCLPQLREKHGEMLTLGHALKLYSDLEYRVAIDRRTAALANVTFEQLGKAMKNVMRLAVQQSLYERTSPNDDLAEIPIEELRGDWPERGRFESTFVFNGQRICVYVKCWKEAQQCPFNEASSNNEAKSEAESQAKSQTDIEIDDLTAACDVIVTNLRSGKTLSYSSLLPHMIKHHGFLEGVGCWYRVNVEDVLDVLGPL